MHPSQKNDHLKDRQIDRHVGITRKFSAVFEVKKIILFKIQGYFEIKEGEGKISDTIPSFQHFTSKMALENPSLFKAMENALLTRQRNGVPVRDISKPMPTFAPDLFSNDYLSLSTDTRLRRLFLERLDENSHVLGTTGTRPLSGSPSQLIALEERLQKFWDAPSALLCNSGYDANLAFFRSVPQATDIVIYDEFVHASIIDGLKSSRASHALIPFSHNSLASLHKCISGVLQAKPDLVTKGSGGPTVFIALESAYSMDGDFAPLGEMVTLVEELLPKGSFHIVVDEAHTTGIYGPQGRGFVSMLGLDRRIHTVLHTFGKGCGFFGGKDYLAK